MLFNLHPVANRDFASFVIGTAQQETVAAVQQVANLERSAYLWGAAGCGKSHLLAAAGQVAREYGLVVAEFGGELASADLVIIDDIDKASKADQAEIFSVFGASLPNTKPYFLIAATAPPAQLNLRKDIASRLSQLPIYHLPSLSDNELCEALVTYAHSFGRPLAAEVARLLVSTLPRNLGFLARTLTDLDKFAITSGEEITASFLRRWLRENSFIK